MQVKVVGEDWAEETVARGNHCANAYSFHGYTTFWGTTCGTFTRSTPREGRRRVPWTGLPRSGKR